MASSLQLDTQRPWNFIQQCPAYHATPLIEITSPQGFPILIKDETNRFNLGAFKALGGIYAIAVFLQDRWQQENAVKLDPNALFEADCQAWSSQFTFVCASAGNHGMAVAKGAQLFNAKSRVHLSNTVPVSFEEKLQSFGASVVRSGQTYEESMQAALLEAEAGDKRTILLSDSSWPGYTELPSLVMEGYTVLAEEMRQAFESSKQWPNHVFLQAGVGGMAAAVAYHIRKHWSEQPQIMVVEPDAAPCLYESNRLGKLTAVKGPESTMGRLDCKEASMLAFASLQQTADKFVCISDKEAADAVSCLAEKDIATTPSGAAGFAAIKFADQLGYSIKESETCLAIVTETQV